MMQLHHQEQVVDSEGVEVQATTPSLEPLTEEQLHTLVDRLLIACEAVPVADDPLGELVCRLALTALQGVRSGVPQEEFTALEEENAQLQTSMEQVVSDRDKVSRHLQDALNQSLAFQRKSERLQGLLVRINNTIKLGAPYNEDGVPELVSEVVKERDEFRSELEVAKASLIEAAMAPDREQELRNLRAEVSSLKGKVRIHSSRADKNASELDQVKKNITKRLLDFEYSALHPTYTFRKGGKVPCCFYCRGLDPERVNHADTGHSKKCVVGKLVRDLLEP